MAKITAKAVAKTVPVKATPKAKEPEPVVEEVEEVDRTPRTRGPKGVDENAEITVLVEANPKRPSSKAFQAFELYAEVNTVAEFINAVDADPDLKGSATGHLVYDTAHGFIQIAGYEPPNGIVEKKPKEPKPEKESKPAKVVAKPAAAKAATAKKGKDKPVVEVEEEEEEVIE